MKTKLDELLSNYLRKDKKASASLTTKAEISENIYEAATPPETIPFKDGNEFISRNIKLWNLLSGKEKPVSGKKEEITFPEFLEFALKTNNKPKDKQENSMDNAISRSPRPKKQNADVPSEILQKEQVLTETVPAISHVERNGLRQEPELSSSSSDENNAKARREWVWVTKGKAERKKAILRVLALHDQISLLDLCRTHASEIGIIWPDVTKWVEKPWKAIRGDCHELSQEKKITFFKDDKRKIQVKLISSNNLLLAGTQISKDMPHPSADPIPSLAGSVDLDKWKESLLAIAEQLDQLSNQIILIWKTITTLTHD